VITEIDIWRAAALMVERNGEGVLNSAQFASQETSMETRFDPGADG
jgi:hypothetical protein